MTGAQSVPGGETLAVPPTRPGNGEEQTTLTPGVAPAGHAPTGATR